jgi:hypothetical protein
VRRVRVHVVVCKTAEMPPIGPIARPRGHAHAAGRLRRHTTPDHAFARMATNRMRGGAPACAVRARVVRFGTSAFRPTRLKLNVRTIAVWR